MKLMKAYIRDFMASNVVNALKDLKVPPITVMGASALGDEINHQVLEILARVGRTHTKMVKIEIICNDECVDKIKNTITATARSGHKGDGLIAFFQLREMKT